MAQTIRLFMWSYQHIFRRSLEGAAEALFRTIGAPGSVKALLVGVRRPGGGTHRHAVCVEPEDGQWAPALFADLENEVEGAIQSHPLQQMFYSDTRFMDEKPERIRRAAIREQVLARLRAYDAANDVLSYCGEPTLVDDHYVAPVIQLPAGLLRIYPVVERVGPEGKPVRISFLESCVEHLLSGASIALFRPDAGRHLDELRWSDEIARRAGHDFMRRVAGVVRCGPVSGALFENINAISAMRYEGHVNVATLAFVGPKGPDVSFLVRLADPVPLKAQRWARKLAQMADGESTLVTDCEHIIGVGRATTEENEEGVSFSVEFGEDARWELYAGAQPLLRVTAGLPSLPFEPVGRDRFIENAERIFSEVSHDAEALWRVWKHLVHEGGGALIVVAADAESEAARLASQGMAIEPTLLDAQLLHRARLIDGSILLDPNGRCHAIGVILDGLANDACTPSRGSRYNSAIRYVADTPAK